MGLKVSGTRRAASVWTIVTSVVTLVAVIGLPIVSRPQAAHAVPVNRLLNWDFSATHDRDTGAGTDYEAHEWNENNFDAAQMSRRGLASGQPGARSVGDGLEGSIYVETGGQAGNGLFIYPDDDAAYANNPPILSQEIPNEHFAGDDGDSVVIEGYWWRDHANVSLRVALEYATACDGDTAGCLNPLGDDCPANQVCGHWDTTNCDNPSGITATSTWQWFSFKCTTGSWAFHPNNVWEAQLVVHPTGEFGHKVGVDTLSVGTEAPASFTSPTWTTGMAFDEIKGNDQDLTGASKRYANFTSSGATTFANSKQAKQTTSPNWTQNHWAGATVTTGTVAGGDLKTGIIASNTADTLTLAAPWTPSTPSANTTFYINTNNKSTYASAGTTDYASSPLTVTHTSPSPDWTASGWIGATVTADDSGVKRTATVTANTATSLTVNGWRPGGTVPPDGAAFTVRQSGGVSRGWVGEMYALESTGADAKRITTSAFQADCPTSPHPATGCWKQGYGPNTVNPVDHNLIAAARFTLDWDQNQEYSIVIDPARIYVLDLVSDRERPITPAWWSAGLGGTTWTTDGHWIVFGANRGGNWEIWKADAWSANYDLYLVSDDEYLTHTSTGTPDYATRTVTQTGAGWTVNGWVGAVVTATNGSYGTVESNTTTQLTITATSWVGGQPSDGTQFTVNKSPSCYESDVNVSNFTYWVTYRRATRVNGQCYLADQKGDIMLTHLETGEKRIVWDQSPLGLSDDGLPFGAFDPGFSADDSKIMFGKYVQVLPDSSTTDTYDTMTMPVSPANGTQTKLFGHDVIVDPPGDWTYDITASWHWNPWDAANRDALAWRLKHNDNPLGYDYLGLITFDPTAASTPTEPEGPINANDTAILDNGLTYPNLMYGGHHFPALNSNYPSPVGALNGFDTNPNNARVLDGALAVANGTGGAGSAQDQYHIFHGLGLEKSVPVGATIDGIRVRLDSGKVELNADTPSVKVDLSWDDGTSWTSQQTAATSGGATTWTTTAQDFFAGGSLDKWGLTGACPGASCWEQAEMDNVRVRVQFKCASTCDYRDWSLDRIDVRVYWH